MCLKSWHAWTSNLYQTIIAEVIVLFSSQPRSMHARGDVDAHVTGFDGVGVVRLSLGAHQTAVVWWNTIGHKRFIEDLIWTEFYPFWRKAGHSHQKSRL